MHLLNADMYIETEATFPNFLSNTDVRAVHDCYHLKAHENSRRIT